MLARTVVILSVLVSVGAFVISPHAVTRTRTATATSVPSALVESVVWKSTSTLAGAGPLLMKKKNVVPEGKPATNILRLISPLNPYMLFVYPILFIIAVDYFNLGPK